LLIITAIYHRQKRSHYSQPCPLKAVELWQRVSCSASYKGLHRACLHYTWPVDGCVRFFCEWCLGCYFIPKSEMLATITLFLKLIKALMYLPPRFTFNLLDINIFPFVGLFWVGSITIFWFKTSTYRAMYRLMVDIFCWRYRGGYLKTRICS
jgi:hypothetical protein